MVKFASMGHINLEGRLVTIFIVSCCFSLLSANECWKHACAHYMLLTCKLQRAARITGLVWKRVKPLFPSLLNCKYADVSVFIGMVNWCIAIRPLHLEVCCPEL